MLKRPSLLDRIVRKANANDSAQVFLEKKYLRILNRRYGVKPDAVSQDMIANFARGNSLLQMQERLSEAVGSLPGKPFIFNGYWRELLVQSLEALPKETGLHDASIFIGEAPDPIFNAEVQDYGKQRYLILVQSGLELFLYRIACVIVASMRLRIGALGSGQIVLEPELDMDAARSIVMRNIEGVFRGMHEWPIALKSETTLALAANYAYALQQFVVAHELGHILQSVRPFSDRSKGERRPPLKVRPELKDDWNQEIVADGFAATICHELIATVTSRGAMTLDLAENVLFEAPYILFVLMEALDKVAASKRLRRWETHPPADMRRSKLLSVQIAQGLHKDFQDMAEDRSQHMRRLAGLAPTIDRA